MIESSLEGAVLEATHLQGGVLKSVRAGRCSFVGANLMDTDIEGVLASAQCRVEEFALCL